MNCHDIICKLEKLSPLKYAYHWDNSGMQVFQDNREITKILIALDATDEVIEEAIKVKAELLIVHHPLMMEGMKQISTNHFIGSKIIKLIQNNITCYAMHTNFDVMGMADAAAEMINLKNKQILSISYQDGETQQGCGRCGTLSSKMTVTECSKYIKETFQIDSIRVYGNPNRTIEKVAIVPGSGGSMIADALKANVDIMITGDIKHHEGLDANEQGLTIIDAGHFGLEKLFITYINNYLKKEFPQVEIHIPNQASPFWVI